MSLNLTAEQRQSLLDDHLTVPTLTPEEEEQSKKVIEKRHAERERYLAAPKLEGLSAEMSIFINAFVSKGGIEVLNATDSLKKSGDFGFFNTKTELLAFLNTKIFECLKRTIGQDVNNIL